MFKTDSPKRQKLRMALDAPVQMEAESVTAKDAVAVVANKLAGVNVMIRAKGLGPRKIDLKLTEPVPLGAALQYIEDELGIVFVLREYGIVVVAADEKLPPGAVRVVDFWKHAKATETKAETKEKQK